MSNGKWGKIMGFMNKPDLMDAMAELKDVDYSKQPKVDAIYKRLQRAKAKLWEILKEEKQSEQF